MFTQSIRLKTAIFCITASIVAIFITKPASSQDAGKSSAHKQIILKVTTDDNGIKTVIDTTMEFSDSAMMDSIHQKIEKIIRIGNDGGRHRFRFHGMPDSYAYDFDLRMPEECRKELEQLKELDQLRDLNELKELRHLKDFDWQQFVPDQEGAGDFWEQEAPVRERKMLRKEGGQKLSDVIGDIPMDRVVRYTIKERKHGKRIIVDVQDYPMFERGDKNVVIIREPGRMRRHNTHPQRRVKVFVNPDRDEQILMEKTPEPPDNPAAPAPPETPSQPEKETPKKSKI